MLLYTFPPVPRLLVRLQEEQLSVILIVSERTGAPRFSDLQQLLSGRHGSCRGGRICSSKREGNQELPRDRPASLGLSAEWECLGKLDPLCEVVHIIYGERAASTTVS
ncbi:hypothetical protein AMECASPLE_016726 [Ameca splendens]|uniref:Uncharacterized protein n=1 Tax=Ameca splendens TaxID=208324 RepID=A0ABV0YDB8_9TELE